MQSSFHLLRLLAGGRTNSRIAALNNKEFKCPTQCQVVIRTTFSRSRSCCSVIPAGNLVIARTGIVKSNFRFVGSVTKLDPEMGVVKASPLSQSKADENVNKPNQDQLQKVHDVLANSMIKLFTQPMDYSVYNPEILFINNIRNKTTQGLLKYVQQVAYLRTIGHLRFAYVRFEILNTHISHEEGRITIRWRINGISGFRVMLKFWKFRLWNWKEIMTQQEAWFDGISYFDVGGDGLVHRHIADKMMEDKSRQVNEVKPTNAALAAKLALLATLFPQPSLTFSTTDAGSVLNATSTTEISNNNFGHDK